MRKRWFGFHSREILDRKLWFLYGLVIGWKGSFMILIHFFLSNALELMKKPFFWHDSFGKISFFVLEVVKKQFFGREKLAMILESMKYWILKNYSKYFHWVLLKNQEKQLKMKTKLPKLKTNWNSDLIHWKLFKKKIFAFIGRIIGWKFFYIFKKYCISCTVGWITKYVEIIPPFVN